MVSSISNLLCGGRPRTFAAEPESNAYATVDGRVTICLLAVLLTGFFSGIARAQEVSSESARQVETAQGENRATSAALFLTGGLLAFGAHEAGHLALDLAFDADPYLKSVDFHGVPFFAVTHRKALSPRRELAVSSAGFWIQHAGSEWILTSKPGLRREHAPLLKGILAFNVATSAAYAGAAFARTGPFERDTRGIADAADIDERWIGAVVLAPAALDAWRYFHPGSKWAAWTSRGVKVGMLLLLVR
jgi:hypothetical protein